MRLVLLFFCLIAGTVSASAADARFEAWAVSCATAKRGPDCRLSTEAPASGATLARLTVSREAAKDAIPRLTLSLVGALHPAPRPRIALAVDGGPPLRLSSGADLSSGPGADASTIELRLSDNAARRLLPFLRRGKALQAAVTVEAGEQIVVELPLAGFGPAVADVDRQQGRADRRDALATVIGGATAAARSGLLRDVSRDTVPPALKTVMVDRDCPVWDQTEANPSFLADESFASDLGGGRTLWAIVCSSGSYNVEFALFVEDPSKAADRFEALLFASFIESLGWTGVDTLSNATYDPEKKELVAFDKGRGAGDCGTVGTWEWVGAAFRMIEYRAKEECDGVGQSGTFPIVFRGER